MIAQTLHGYDKGHRLLAQGGDVDEAELGILDRLSDLSGYVPLGTTFDSYHTAFPCGRYYAFACTWPDTSATRAGTVLTHTLLVPLGTLAEIHDIWALGCFHRQPVSAQDRAPYEVSLGRSLEQASPPALSADRARAALALWFGQAERPVLWMEEARPSDVVRFLWGLLWPDARRRFTFCTFALQARQIRRRPFGFLALPRAALGSFHERARSAAWWQEGELLSTELAQRASQSWAKSILERGKDATWAMPRFCDDHQLPALSEVDFPLFHRFIELEQPARERLTAARARADLLVRLWPEIPPSHALTRSALGDLMRRQSDAPLSPRPLWELDDLLSRPITTKLAEIDPSFMREVAMMLTREVQRRFIEMESETIADLAALLKRGLLPLLQQAVFDAIRAALSSAGPDEGMDTKAIVLLASAPSILVQPIISALSEGRRVAVVLGARLRATPEALLSLDHHVMLAAEHLRDPALIAEILFAQGKPLEAMRAASAILLALPAPRPEQLSSIFGRLDAPLRLVWALSVTEPALSAWAGDRGADAAAGLPLGELFERSAKAPNGGPVLLSRLGRMTVTELRREAGLKLAAPSLLALALGDPSQRGARILEAIVEALEDDDLIVAPVAAAFVLPTTAASAIPRQLAERIAPRLVRQIVKGAAGPEARAGWLSLPAMREALGRLPSAALFPARDLRDSDVDALPSLARASAEQIDSGGLGWIASWLEGPLLGASKQSLERALLDLEALLAAPPEREGWLLLAAQALSAVRRTGSKTASKLVERAFSVLYPRLRRGELSSAVRAALSKSIYDWDVAKSWRHWLLDVWIDHRWPPASFLRCLNDDEDLFYRIAKRSRWKWSGRDFFRSLAEAAASERALSARWRAPIERALGTDDLGVDHD